MREMDFIENNCRGPFSAMGGPIADDKPTEGYMRGQQINSLSGKILIILSLTALLAVLSGYSHPPLSDEGAAAHIFQLSVVALLPMILVFLLTADWKTPLRSIRLLALPVVALLLALGALYLP